jgi:predicted ArsR family transcriptional regulator
MQFLAAFLLKNKTAPTLGEIAGELKVSTVTIFEHLGALERKGAIRKGEKGCQRSIEILDANFLPVNDAALYRAALARLSKATGTPQDALDAEIRASLTALAPEEQKDQEYYRVKASGLELAPA